jgi:hypothetical protein
MVAEMKLAKGIESAITFLRSMNMKSIESEKIQILIQNAIESEALINSISQDRWNEAINNVKVAIA